MLKIAVDAMGGDFAPTSEVSGAVEAAHDFGIGVILVGRTEDIEAEMRRHYGRSRPGRASNVELVDAREVIAMDDPVATSVRRKRNSSIRVAAKLVHDGSADALVSAGNTGAVMMTSKLVVGTLSNVDRPALAAVMPTVSGQGTVILDVGANAECKPLHLYQFAVMGSLFSNVILGVANPRVGLLSIGEEEVKGNDLTKEAFKLLKKSPLNFIGNVEGRDMYTGEADVIICDGFTGNVALKVSEGLIETVMRMLKEELQASLQTKAGAFLSKPAFERFKQRLDYAEYGGAPLLGINGVTVICHGRSNSRAIRNAIRVARDFCQGNINSRIEAEIGARAAATR
ncbi:MAG: phosphate acyltransferase PlsX [Blastocatellia bacterium AA13]|nr:MAG: phosphate acyltransferase PlsX [Blastocatellia bacterium AA13]